MTKIKWCACDNKWQDIRYGTNKRVMNETKTVGLVKVYRCTVCGREHSD